MERESIVHIEVRRTDRKALQLWLDGGANPNSVNERGETPLHISASMNSPEFTKMLLDAGADANPAGRSLLACALSETVPTSNCAQRQYATVKLLLEAGADPRKVSSTLFRPDMLSLLKQHGFTG